MKNCFGILIPTWNNLPYLKYCIESIFKNATFIHQIIVHVNDENDGTIEYIKAHNIDYTQLPQNIGICKALNLSAKKAIHSFINKYICYFNDDMYALSRWDYHLVN